MVKVRVDGSARPLMKQIATVEFEDFKINTNFLKLPNFKRIEREAPFKV
jgi:hypothetical protein